MVVVLLPRPDDLLNAPERAPLALLDAALAVARAALLAENPDVAVLGDPAYGNDPPTCVLAARLVAHADAMHHLLAAYFDALDDVERVLSPDDFDLPF
jgi:hypothetical protein